MFGSLAAAVVLASTTALRQSYAGTWPVAEDVVLLSGLCGIFRASAEKQGCCFPQ
jgi:hypothetical protein